MPVEQLLDYLEKQRQGADEELKNYHQSQDTESLHRFRVHLKKLKAGIQLIGFKEESQKFKKIKGKVKKLFLEAGDVREKELIELWLRRHRLQEILTRKHIRKRTEKAKEELASHHKKFEKSLYRLGEVLHDSAKTMKEADMRKYWRNLVLQWKKEQSLVPPSTHWHDRRKLAKKMLYTRNAFPENKQTMLLTKSRANALDHLQDVIGLWHDDVLLKQWLVQARRANGGRSDELREALSKALQKVNESLAKKSLEVSQAFSKTKAELLVR
jgi:CHAD domain-containing protein